MQNLKTKLENLFKSKAYNITADVVFTLMIVIYGFWRVNRGLDITDTAYNYSNFKYMRNLDDMWFFSTFFSNLLGRLFTLLPWGATMLGLNIYTGLCKNAILVIAYFFMTRDLKIRKELVFLAEIMVAGLNWCPTAVLYNYLSYLLLLLGVIFIYKAVESERKRFFFLAGLMLGLNVFVRLPNLCEAILIAGVWYASWLKKDKFKVAVGKTLICLSGYLTAAAFSFITAITFRGAKAYLRGITEMLQGGGESTGQYTPLGLIFTAFSGYIGIAYWALTALAVFVVLLIFFIIGSRAAEKYGDSKKATAVKLIMYVTAVLAGGALIIRFETTDLYTYNYYEYSSMYGINVIALLIAIVCLVSVIIRKDYEQNRKVLSALLLLVIFATPLGSNNGMYSTLNNLYLVLPMMFSVVFAKEEHLKALNPLKVTAGMLIFVAFIHSFRFGLTFSFRDGGGLPMESKVTNNAILKGMKTVESNAQYLTEISDIWEENYKGDTILVFGNAAGLSFYLDAKPAISTVWPSLASFSLQKYQNDIRYLRGVHDNKGVELPIIVLGNDGIDAFICKATGDDERMNELFTPTYIEKFDILYDFLNYYNYSSVYTCDTFYVYAPK